jgi:hypothetical protein
MPTRTLLTLAVIGLLLGGCASGPRFTPDTAGRPDRGTVYVYRPGAFGAAVRPNVTANGVVLGELQAQGYFVYHAAPGELELTAKTEATSSVTVDVKGGQTYYVKGSIGMGFFVGHPHLVIVSNDVGEKEIVECKLVPGTVPTAEDVAKGPPPAPPKK